LKPKLQGGPAPVESASSRFASLEWLSCARRVHSETRRASEHETPWIYGYPDRDPDRSRVPPADPPQASTHTESLAALAGVWLTLVAIIAPRDPRLAPIYPLISQGRLAFLAILGCAAVGRVASNRPVEPKSLREFEGIPQGMAPGKLPPTLADCSEEPLFGRGEALLQAWHRRTAVTGGAFQGDTGGRRRAPQAHARPLLAFAAGLAKVQCTDLAPVDAKSGDGALANVVRHRTLVDWLLLAQ